MDPSDGVFGRFDLAALGGCHTLNVCYVVVAAGAAGNATDSVNGGLLTSPRIGLATDHGYLAHTMSELDESAASRVRESMVTRTLSST